MESRAPANGPADDEGGQSNKGYVIGWTIFLVVFCAFFIWYLLTR
jgi:hypothetical protein